MPSIKFDKLMEDISTEEEKHQFEEETRRLDQEVALMEARKESDSTHERDTN